MSRPAANGASSSTPEHTVFVFVRRYFSLWEYVRPCHMCCGPEHEPVQGILSRLGSQIAKGPESANKSYKNGPLEYPKNNPLDYGQKLKS